MNRRHVLTLAALALLAGVSVAAALIATEDADPASPDRPTPTTSVTSPRTQGPEHSDRPTTQRPTPKVASPPVDLIPRSDTRPRHPVNLDVPNEPEAVAEACAKAIWSWDTVTDNSPTDAATRCSPLATGQVDEQLRQRVTHVDRTWTSWARREAWVSVETRVHKQYAADVDLKLEWVDLTATQHAKGRRGWSAVGDDIRMSVGLTRRGKSWRVAKVAVW